MDLHRKGKHFFVTTNGGRKGIFTHAMNVFCPQEYSDVLMEDDYFILTTEK